ncbi:Tex family protein [Candidatus Uabimicrobium amorphum]|uniref:RNA-binding protein n=1 Tax=Uabimicrobium amorphum TaxID=2596890 RepID=A0A5S9IKM0_UABAM|nr:Tex family protein [Candidatus Uabimicrobium amorphum]BBM83608.1 RNA-binding protein [Candidatus Uabimicrobium amorphum]
MQDIIIKRICDHLTIPSKKVEGTIALLDEGNTIPFITRYRKEATGGLDEQQIQDISDQLERERSLEKRKQEVTEKIKEQGKLTTELEHKISEASQLKTLEDIYLPFRPKRRTRALIAKEKGLEPFAMQILHYDTDNPQQQAREYINPQQELDDIEQVLGGAMDIIAEVVAENSDVREIVRNYTGNTGTISVAKTSKGEDPDQIYKDYYEYEEKVTTIPAHRILAIDRGENAKVLRIKVEVDDELICQRIARRYTKKQHAACTQYIEEAVTDGYKRLIAPAISREIRSELTDKAHQHAIDIFAQNLRNLLMQAPLQDMCLLAIDPGYVSGCKLAVISATGELLDYAAVFPHQPQRQMDKAQKTILSMCEKHDVNAIVIGNGTACRETEELVAEIIAASPLKLVYTIVSEAGASVYSASKEAREEFPDLDASYRGTISIGRRVLDPLAELVKIDPKSLGVGLYQHDVNGKKLDQALERIVASCVNYVGVDLNRASSELLSHVAGINSRIAKNIVQKRKELGRFTSRKDLKNVSGIGSGTFTQCAGFLRIQNSREPLDETAIHPESYKVCEKLFDVMGCEKKQLHHKEVNQKLQDLDVTKIASQLDVGVPTMKDIFENLMRPGRDPREELPKPIFRSGVLSLEDLEPGMELKGTVRNVIDFGAFVDIGVKVDGLVHISQMSRSYVKNPMDICKIGDNIDVKILSVDTGRKRISLSMVLGD